MKLILTVYASADASALFAASLGLDVLRADDLRLRAAVAVASAGAAAPAPGDDCAEVFDAGLDDVLDVAAGA